MRGPSAQVRWWASADTHLSARSWCAWVLGVVLSLSSCSAFADSTDTVTAGAPRPAPELERTYLVISLDGGQSLDPRPRSAFYGVHASLVPWISDDLLWLGCYLNPSVGRGAQQEEMTPRVSGGVRGGYAIVGLGAGPSYDLSTRRFDAQTRLDLSFLLLRNYPQYLVGCCPTGSPPGERCACGYTPSGLTLGPFVSFATNFGARRQVVLGASFATGTAL